MCHWGYNYKTYLKQLFTLQKRIARLICKLPWCYSTKSSFKEPKSLTLENINRYQILLFMFCFHHNLLPNVISHVIALGIQTNSQIRSHHTRASHHYSSKSVYQSKNKTIFHTLFRTNYME